MVRKRFKRYLLMPLLGAAILSCPHTRVRGQVLKMGEIRVLGNEKIKTYIIRREIPLWPGDVFSAQTVARAKNRIRRIPGVDYAEIIIKHNPGDSTAGPSADLSVFVTEKSESAGYPVIRRGYQNKMSFGLRVVENNFRGRSESISASALLRGNSTFYAQWENPWLGSGQRKIGVGLSFHLEDYRYVYNDLGKLFLDSDILRYGGEFRVFRTFSAGPRISAAVGFESVESGVEGVTLKADGDRYLTVGVGFDYDGRDSRYFPWSGVTVTASGREIGPADKTYSIIEGRLEASSFVSIFERAVVALGANVTYRHGDRIPLYHRDHLGGSRTLRGRKFGFLHGTRSMNASVEYRIPLNFSRAHPVEDLLFGVSAHLFADAGAAWEDDRDLTADVFHGTFGAGILLLNGSVPGLRIDYGWHRRSNGRLEIDVGTKF